MRSKAGGIRIATDALEQFRIAYDIHLWLRYLTCLGLAGGALLLLRVSGGFPPQAWYLLFQVIPRVPHLFATRGPVMLLPLLALVVLSLTWLVLWGTLLCAGVAVALQWWYSGNGQQAQRKKQATPTSWEPSRRLSANHDSNQVFNLAEAFLDPFGFVETQKTPAPAKLKPARDKDVNAAGAEDVGIGWDAGITRRFKPNEDSLVVLRSICTHNDRLLPIDLYVVADGMGGHSRGQEASRLAIQGMMQAVLPDILSSDQLNDEFLIETLVEGVKWANQSVHESSQANAIEMGATITAALVFDGTAYIVNVGDSRTYLYRESGGLSQVTRDHSIVARLVEAGAISRDEVYTHPDRNKVYRGLGEKSAVKVDSFILPVQAGDYLILCSDGLWEMVRDAEIERIMQKYAANPPQASNALVKAALQGGGADNISVIVAHVA